MITGRGLLLPAYLIVAFAGCTGYVQRNGDPVTIVRAERPRWAVIGTTSGEVILHAPRVEGDSLIGARVTQVGETPEAPVEWRVLAVDQVDWVGTERIDEIKSIKAGIAIGVAAFPIVHMLLATR